MQFFVFVLDAYTCREWQRPLELYASDQASPNLVQAGGPDVLVLVCAWLTHEVDQPALGGVVGRTAGLYDVCKRATVGWRRPLCSSGEPELWACERFWGGRGGGRGGRVRHGEKKRRGAGRARALSDGAYNGAHDVGCVVKKTQIARNDFADEISKQFLYVPITITTSCMIGAC